MILRDYQRRAVDSIGRSLATAPSTLLVLPTGTGKTAVFAHVIKEHCDGRAIVLVHREELLWQNVRTIESVLGDGSCDVERAELTANNSLFGSRVVVASKDSLRGNRLERYRADEYGLVVTDECQHSVSKSYRRVYEHFAGVPHLGVTATPDRLDMEALGQVYETVAFDYEISDAISDGWLVPIQACTPFVEDLRIDRMRTKAGDLDQAELDEQMRSERIMHKVCATIVEEAGERRSIVFTVSVRQAQDLSEILNRYKPGCAAWISGEMRRDVRADTIRQHKRGTIAHLVNCGITTEGYDDPEVSMIVMARPTKSRALFAQMIGRGTRPLAGIFGTDNTSESRRDAIANSAKPDLYVLSFTGNCGRHKLVTPADVLGGKYHDEDVASAGQQDGNVLENLDAARKARLAANAPAVADYKLGRARIVALVKYVLNEEDLFDGPFQPGREQTWARGRAPTEKQVACLEQFGFQAQDVQRMSRNECSRIIGESILRRQRGFCTLKQARLLGRMGVSEEALRAMSFSDASQRIDHMIGSRRR
jgi:superfamily II DNA or RNA helicase